MSDRYNQPPEDKDDWHIPLNENFYDIGEDIDALEADVDSISGFDHTLSDTLDAQDNDIINGGSIEADDVKGRVINGSEVNAGWFDTYDDARQFCVDNDYGKIYVPAGTYNEPCHVPAGVQVYGDGYATHFDAPGTGGSVGQDGILREIQLSTGEGQLDDAIDGVGSGAIIDGVVISYAHRNGILVRGSNDTTIIGVRFEGQIGNNGIQYFSSSSGNIINRCWIAGGIQNPSDDNIVGNEIHHI